MRGGSDSQAKANACERRLHVISAQLRSDLRYDSIIFELRFERSWPEVADATSQARLSALPQRFVRHEDGARVKSGRMTGHSRTRKNEQDEKERCEASQLC